MLKRSLLVLATVLTLVLGASATAPALGKVHAKPCNSSAVKAIELHSCDPPTTINVILDFEELKKGDGVMHSWGRVVGGIGRNPALPFVGDACAVNPRGCFILIAHHWSPVANPPGFETVGTSRPEYPLSTALYTDRSTGEIVLTRTDSGPFDLTGISLAEFPSTSGGVPDLSEPWDITFYGKKENGKVVSEVVRVLNSADPVLALEDFQFRRLNDVVSVSWFQGGGGPQSPTHQFDNILVETLIR